MASWPEGVRVRGDGRVEKHGKRIGRVFCLGGWWQARGLDEQIVTDGDKLAWKKRRGAVDALLATVQSEAAT